MYSKSNVVSKIRIVSKSNNCLYIVNTNYNPMDGVIGMQENPKEGHHYMVMLQYPPLNP